MQEKKQTDQQQKQAFHAGSLVYKIEPNNSDRENRLNNKKKIFSTKKKDFKLNSADWRPVYDNLNSEIKLRHYSPKTVKAYRGWVRHFQNFTKSKNPQSLTDADGKEFLTFLAVDKKISASSQNQAFNSLLFFFRHIIKTEFGGMKDIPRAKRKPYIPVVLSSPIFWFGL